MIQANFREENLRRATSSLDDSKGRSGKNKQHQANADCYRLVKMIMV